MLKITTDNKLQYFKENEVVTIEAYGPNIIRVKVAMEKIPVNQDWTLLPVAESNAVTEMSETEASLISGNAKAVITDKGHITFYNQNGKELLKEKWTIERDGMGRLCRGKSGRMFSAQMDFWAKEEEHFYGMGQEAHDLFDLKGSVIDLCQQNTKATIPFVVSTAGYGFLWNNPAIGRAEFGVGATRWFAQETKQVDYLVMVGDTVPEICKLYMGITGKAPKFPYWATGMWQSKLRYRNQEELLTVAREYYEKKIPISMMVCDFFHWPHQGDWKFDEKFWPDPAGMVKELEDMGMKLLVSIWPTVEKLSENYEEMKEQNMLIRSERGVSYISEARVAITYYDATNPEAGEFVWGRSKKNYFDYGIKNFWLDEAEPEIWPYDYDNLRYELGSGLEVSNIYPYYYAKNFYDGLIEQGETEVVNLIRCAFMGSQKYGVVLWSGDIASTFDSFRRQIKAGLNVSLCGIPWWTTDIGGFNGGDIEDPEFKECVVRWFQFGAFCPVFRMHGDRKKTPEFLARLKAEGAEGTRDVANEIWSYGEEAYEIMKYYIRVREYLRPYIMEQFDLASEDGTAIMRPLFYDFDEPECYKIYDQYMFGPDIMPCPVDEYLRRERDVYLPNGCEWIDANSNTVYNGGQWIHVEAPLSRMPIFIKKGSTVKAEWFLDECKSIFE
ncbi:MAG: glycoside hydrolase family 31 protein [Eubacteriales bacterium]